ncbi:MAG TPA: ABC transporter permease, partial [Bacteroidota bacterium]|nr:ABC transporter permease [Bacteroidota bacterium]
MFSSYLTIAFRNLRKRETSSWISIAGLAIAISCCIFILLFIFDELQFDRFHVNGDRIYRGVYSNTRTGERAAIMAGVLFPKIMSAVPEFESGCRLTRRTDQPIRIGQRLFTGDLFFADQEILQMMSFPLERGDPGTALKEPFTAVLTDSLAKRYFGQEEPIGRTFIIDDKYEFRVTGILRDIPKHSHIRPEFIASLNSYNTIDPRLLNDIRESGTYFYFLLRRNASPAAAEAKLQKVFESHHGEDT